MAQQRWGSSEEGSISGCLPAYAAAEETGGAAREWERLHSYEFLDSSPPLGWGYQVSSECQLTGQE